MKQHFNRIKNVKPAARGERLENVIKTLYHVRNCPYGGKLPSYCRLLLC